MPELRRDPLSGRWVVIAPERALRPSEILPPDVPTQGGLCPFCPGHEHLTPLELLAYRPNGGPANGPGWTVRGFPNRYPALRIEERGDREAEGFYDRMGGVGAHEIVVDSPSHEIPLAKASPAQVTSLVAALRDRIRDLRRDARLRAVLPFKNQGSAAGATLEHSHWQLLALPLIPGEILNELAHAHRYHQEKERCLFCDILRAEERSGPRWVADNAEMLALAPFAARVPFETWILPRHHGSAFEELSDAQVSGLGELLQQTLAKVAKALDRPAYNLVFHSAPLREAPLEYYHWHVEILPVLTRAGGFEWGSGSYINPTPPEEAADFLRKISL